jgi:hypothetical protein
LLKLSEDKGDKSVGRVVRRMTVRNLGGIIRFGLVWREVWSMMIRPCCIFEYDVEVVLRVFLAFPPSTLDDLPRSLDRFIDDVVGFDPSFASGRDYSEPNARHLGCASLAC